jgi:hypothetical protein
LRTSRNSLKAALQPTSSLQAATGTTESGDGADKLKRERATVGRLYKAADAAGADSGAVDELRRYLDAHPHLTEKAEVLTLAVEDTLLAKVDGGRPGVRELLRAELKGIRDRLDYEDAPEIEQLIIAEIVIAWLWLQWHQCQFAAADTWKLGEYWDKKLSGAQKRFLRACESLAKVRRLTERKMSPAALSYLRGMMNP